MEPHVTLKHRPVRIALGILVPFIIVTLEALTLDNLRVREAMATIGPLNEVIGILILIVSIVVGYGLIAPPATWRSREGSERRRLVIAGAGYLLVMVPLLMFWGFAVTSLVYGE